MQRILHIDNIYSIHKTDNNIIFLFHIKYHNLYLFDISGTRYKYYIVRLRLKKEKKQKITIFIALSC